MSKTKQNLVQRLKSVLIILLRKCFEKLNRRLSNSSSRFMQIPPVGYFDPGDYFHNMQSLKSFYDPCRLFGLLCENDWPLYQNFLYSENLVIIGGYRGNNLNRFLSKNLKVIHIYEPLQQFASQIKSSDHRVTIYQEAVGQSPGHMAFFIAEDYSCFSHLERKELPRKLEETIVPVVDISTVSARLSGAWTLFMNCEGSEYEIIDNLFRYIKLGKVSPPHSIIFQSHKIGDFPFATLLATRQQLATYYTNLLTFDWAWDVWTFNKNESL